MTVPVGKALAQNNKLWQRPAEFFLDAKWKVIEIDPDGTSIKLSTHTNDENRFLQIPINDIIDLLRELRDYDYSHDNVDFLSEYLEEWQINE